MRGVVDSVASQDQARLVLTGLSRLLGWMYTLAWSASFYPQVIHNHFHKSTRGLSSDFVVLNATGHTSYLLYNTLLFFCEPVRQAYRKAHGGLENLVQWNDWFFSAHATLLSLITLAQYLVYKTQDQHISYTLRLSLVLVLSTFVLLLVALYIHLVDWLAIITASSTLKLLITLTKYLPQIQLNLQRKSTKGFTIQNILLDLLGGLLSLLQLFIDAVLIQASWNGFWADWAKLGLGLLSITFDLVLIWQHYVVYGPVDVVLLYQHDQDITPQNVQDQTHPNRHTNYGSTQHHSQSSSTSTTTPNNNADESSSLLH